MWVPGILARVVRCKQCVHDTRRLNQKMIACFQREGGHVLDPSVVCNHEPFSTAIGGGGAFQAISG